MLRTRLATAAVALPALWLIVQYLWTPLFNGFIVSVAAIALYEYFTMAFPDDPPLVAVGVAFGLLIAAAVLTGDLAWVGGALSLTVIGGFTLPLARHENMRRSVESLGLIVLGVLYLGFFVPHMILLRQEPEGWRWVLFTVYTAMGSDTGGYFAGRYLGKRKLAPAISPSKTVEGALGAFGGAVVIALFCHTVFFDRMGLGPTIGFALGIGLLAQLGDLCESALKRAFGAKDSGWIIPGHGGILDRLDSLLFPFVFAYYYAAVVARG